MAFAAFNSLFFTIFVLSALVQYNDADAIIWIAIYLSAAVMCASAFRNRSLHWLPPLLLFVCLGWIISPASGVIGVVSMAEITASIRVQSDAVEVGGIATIDLWSACLIYRQRRRQRGRS